MKITLKRPQTPAMPSELYTLINQVLMTAEPKSSNAITLNFRDPEYSAEAGGFHPVEIRLEKQDAHWRMVYMTDFAFHGYPIPELIKDIDICFNSNQVYSSLCGWMCPQECKELIKLFIENFISYHSMDVYQVRVSHN